MYLFTALDEQFTAIASQDRMTDRSFDDSIITNASTVRARDWRTLSSRSDSRFDISPRVSVSPRTQTPSRGSSSSHMIIAICEGRGSARREIGECRSELGANEFPRKFIMNND